MQFINRILGRDPVAQNNKQVVVSQGASKESDGFLWKTVSLVGRLASWNESTDESYCIILSSRTQLLSSDRVGGKAHNLIKLFRMGVHVPQTCILTCDEYENGKNSGNITKMSKDMLERFLDPNSKYAVRSSASCEDGADSAFAGRFTTELNVPGNVDEIEKAVARCWNSMKAPELADKISAKDRMGVVIMRQINSSKSGVLFQANPVTGSPATYVITAAFGQGEGVVGGKVAVDTYSLKESTLEIKNKQIAKKTRMIALDVTRGGIVEQDVPQAKQSEQCLADNEIIQVAKAGKVIRAHCHSPQDVEFCFDENGKLYILQTRPITTLAETLEWKAPEPGLWNLNGHMATPMSEFYGPIWMYGHSAGSEVCTGYMGMGVVKVDTTLVNGFGYFCMRNPGPKAAPKSLPPPFILRNIIRLTGRKAIKDAQNYWQNKIWRDFMLQTYPKLKQEWRAQADEWKAKAENAPNLDDSDLAKLVSDAHEYGKHMYFEHARVTMYNLGPIAFFVQSLVNEINCSPVEGFSCVDGFSPISMGYAGEFPEQIALIAADPVLEKEISDEKLTLDAKAAKAKWLEIKQRTDKTPALQALQEILDTIQYRLAEGYDTANSTFWQCPSLVFTGLMVAIKRFRERTIEKARGKAIALSNELLGRVTDVHKRAELESILEEARLVAPLRDERALLTDLIGMGIIHHILLEAGKRLANRARAKGEEVDERLVLLASKDEIVENLQDKGAAAPSKEFWDRLVKRNEYRTSASINDAPQYLGGNLLVPSKEHFPDPFMARSVHNVIFVVQQIFDAPDMELESKDASQYLQNDKNVIVGFSGSRGTVRGTARVVKTAEDAAALLPGEICVTKYPSSVVNIVLGKAAAIVTDLGGILCHAAICARESDLPCVVGCHTATTRVKNGDVIEVDGTKGIVRIVDA